MSDKRHCLRAKGNSLHSASLTTCTHNERDVGPCPQCGECAHEFVVNGVCFYCGEDDPKLTIKPRSAMESSNFVPLDSVRRKR